MIFNKKTLTRKKLINSIIFFLIAILISTYIDFKKTNDQDLKRFSIEIKIVDLKYIDLLSAQHLSIAIDKILKNCIQEKYGKIDFSQIFSGYKLTFFSERNLGCKYHDYNKLEFARTFSAELHNEIKIYILDLLTLQAKGNYQISELEKSINIKVLSIMPLPKNNLFDPRPILVFVLMIALFYFLLKYHDEKD